MAKENVASPAGTAFEAPVALESAESREENYYCIILSTEVKIQTANGLRIVLLAAAVAGVCIVSHVICKAVGK